MSARDALYLFHPSLCAWRLAEDHPFRPERLQALTELLLQCGLLTESEILEPEPLPASELARIHSEEYLRVVRRLSRGDAVNDSYRFGLGTTDTPWFRGMHETLLQVTAASATAVRAVVEGRVTRAASFAGGHHHAQVDRASGFCIYDDASVAILQALDRGLRVAYLDLDAHHGDGVQQAFYQDDRVLTVSLHESGRYLFPGTGHGYELGSGPGRGFAVNLPLEPFTDDDGFLEVFDAVVPAALAAFEPDLVVVQCGADGHVDDPLADLNLTVAGMQQAYRRVSELADRHCQGRMVALGGGGYDPFAVVPRAWTYAWAELTGRDPPAVLPDAWRERWSQHAGRDLPRELADAPRPDAVPEDRRAQIRHHNQAVAKRALGVLRPIWEQAKERSRRHKEGTT